MRTAGRLVPDVGRRRRRSRSHRSDGQLGWRRCHCSGARRIRSSSAWARSWVTRCDVVAQLALAASVSSGGQHDAAAEVGPVEVDRGGEERRAGAQGEGGRTAGQRRALAEELDLGTGAGEVAVAEQREGVVGLEGPDRGRRRRRGRGRRPRSRTSGAARRTTRTARGGSSRSTTAVTGAAAPASPRSPTTPSRRGAGRAMIAPVPASRAASSRCQPSARNPASRSAALGAGQPERLLLVAGVALEGRVDEPAQRGARQRRVDPPQVALDLGPALRGQVAGERARAPRARRRRRGAGAARARRAASL